jgi:ligand-binding sensor domain-containing protein/signal transduction histidine kinase
MLPTIMPKKSRVFHFAGRLACLCAVALSAAAGPAPEMDPAFIVDSWTAENGPGKGPPDNEIISVIQTLDGYLWLGTLHGLARFDGVNFTCFNKNNTPGLNSDRIVHLFEDSRTNLWVGTDAGDILIVNQGRIQALNLGHATHEKRLVSAAEDSAGAVWLYTADAQLMRYRNGNIDALSLNFQTPPITRMIAIEKPGELWIADVGGMHALQAEHFQPKAVVIDQSLPAARLDFILPSPSGGIWCLKDGRVLKIHGAGRQTDFGAYPWGNSAIKAACEDAEGHLIVGTLGSGIYWYDESHGYEHISKREGLSSDLILSLWLDREGNLWAGTDGDGLNRVKRKEFSTSANLHPWVAQSISADGHDGLWAAFNAHGMSYWTTNSVQAFGIGQASNAWSVLVDTQRRVWGGTLGEGLFRLQDNRFQPAPDTAILGPQIFALFEGHDGQIWAGTRNGLARFDGQNWKLFTTRDGLADNAVRAIAEDAGGTIWAGTENGGLASFKGGKFVSFRAGADGPPGDDISCLYPETNGVLWVGTAGHGLARLENGKWTRFASTNGLASDNISYITGDDAGFLWIGSVAGLMRVSRQSLDNFAAGVTNVISCRTYGKADGLPTRECSAGSQPATGRTPDGRLWFATTKGVVSVLPAQLKTNLQPPLVKIESVRVEGRQQITNRLVSSWPQSVTIPPGGEELEIQYTALNFSAPDQVRFKCWLQGHEARPTDVGAERIARYPKLPPGRYTFHVQACNEDNVWSGPDGAVLTILVQPQFWQTAWFRLGGILFLLGIVAASVRYVSTQKLRRQLQAHRQREALEHERARIARDLHDQIGANLTQVALLGEMAEADKDAPAEVEQHAQQISQTARETTRGLDEIVWAVNPANDTLDGLVNYAGKYAQEYLALAGVRCRADLPAQLPAILIAPEVRHNVFLAFKEAVHNVVKHAQATEARIRLRLEPEQLILEVEDNGRGVPHLDSKPNRNGLRNMKKRMEDIHGGFSIGPAPERGTIVRLTAPVKLNHG